MRLAAAGWDELLGRAGGRDPLRLSPVLRLTEGAGGGTPRAILVERSGRLVAAAPLAVGRERGLATVRHLGQAPNWFDPEPPAADEAAYAALADAIAAQPGDLLVLEELPADGPMVRALLARRPDAEILPGPAVFRIHTASPRARGGPRRREARRLARRAQDRGTPLEVRVVRRWDELEPLVDEALALQWASWRDREPDAFTGTDGGRAVVRAIVEAAARDDRVRLVRLTVGGRLAAFHLSVVWGTRAVVFKTAFDRGLQGLPGLGWASLIATVDALAAEGVRVLDLGPYGDFKAHIADTTDTLTLRFSLSSIGRAYLRSAAVKRGAVRRLRTPR